MNSHFDESNVIPFQPASPTSRLLITLVIDTSSSMSHNGGIDQLNQALPELQRALSSDFDIGLHGEVALVTFGKDGVNVWDLRAGQPVGPASGFIPVADFRPPILEAGGVTPMVEALQRAMQLSQQRKAELRSEGLTMKARPLMYLITDGGPTDESGHPSDDWRSLVPVIQSHEQGRHLSFFAFGVSGADQAVLRELAPIGTHMLDSLDFSLIFKLVSASIDAAQHAPMGSDPETQKRLVDDKITRFFEEYGGKPGRNGG